MGYEVPWTNVEVLRWSRGRNSANDDKKYSYGPGKNLKWKWSNASIKTQQKTQKQIEPDTAYLHSASVM